MKRRGIGHGACLTVAIACALAACSSGKSKGGGSDDNGKKAVSMQHARNDAGMSADAGEDAGDVMGGAGSGGPPKLKEPPAKYGCMFSSHGGHGYWFCATKIKREPGRSVCRQLGGDSDFVVIDDAAENAWIADQIGADTYIGYSDADKEGRWSWVNPSNATFENWDTKQPGNDDYAFMEKSSGRWKSTFDVALAFACEGTKLTKP